MALLEQPSTYGTVDLTATGGFSLPGVEGCERLLLDCERLADPLGFDAFVGAAERSLEEQQALRDQIGVWITQRDLVAKATEKYAEVFDKLAVSIQSGKREQDTAPVEQHAVVGLQLREQRHALTDERLVVASMADTVWGGMSAYLRQRREAHHVVILGTHWDFEEGYLAEFANSDTMPTVHGVSERLTVHRKLMNGGNTPREKDQIKARIASPEDDLRLLDMLEVVRTYHCQ